MALTPELQSVLALAIVALAITYLVWRAVAKRRGSSCGSGECGALSADVKKLQAHLKKR